MAVAGDVPRMPALQEPQDVNPRGDVEDGTAAYMELMTRRRQTP